MSVRPRLADVSCSKVHFDPGDRIIVRTFHQLNIEEKKKLTKTIQKWAGCEIEVLIYCILDMEMEIERGPILPFYQ